MTHRLEIRRQNWLNAEECGIEAFASQQARQTDPTDYPFASGVVNNVPVYDGEAVRAAASLPERRQVLLAEWSDAMMQGSGVIVLRGAMTDLAVVDAATARFDEIIAEQRASGAAAADHFAKPGANDRIWNALEKLCLRDPELFAAYYGNASIALVSEAWLGPAYQVTSQVNCGNPGARRSRRIATTISASSRPRRRRAIRRTCTGSPRR
jgi:hypothetical protein